MLERLALQQFHAEKGLALMLVDLVDGADVRMIKGGGGAGLALKTVQRCRIGRKIRGQELEGNMPAELEVLSFIHHTHAATAKLLQDSVMGNGCADHWMRKYSEEVYRKKLLIVDF